MYTRGRSEKLPYRAAAASSQCPGADWNTPRAEGNPTARCTDPRLHRAEPEEQCTLGDLERFDQDHHKGKWCAGGNLLLWTLKNVQPFFFVGHNNTSFSDVLAPCAFCCDWPSCFSVYYPWVYCGGMRPPPPLTFGCSPVDGRAGVAPPHGGRSVLKE